MIDDPRDPSGLDVLTDVGAFTARGLPRRRFPAPSGARTPIPWVNGAWPVMGQWTRFDNERIALALTDRRCFVCGERVEGPLYYVRYWALGEVEIPVTDGPGGHAGCALIAVRSCPNLRRSHEGRSEVVVAYRYDGDGLGSETLEDVSERTGHPLRSLRRIQGIKTVRLVTPPSAPVTLGELAVAR